MKNFLGSLKHKPRKIDLIAHQNADVSALANSAEGAPEDLSKGGVLAGRYTDDAQ